MCPEVDSASENGYQGKGGRCVWLTTYHPCSAESREDPGLNLPGNPRATSACRGIPLLFFFNTTNAQLYQNLLVLLEF